ncbi:MAG: dihydroneopterin aldolase [Gammaproteobacteria bacterium]|nr:dihydroneopterin aldolase [Gammaproteobacteria bacterium]
MRSELTLNQFRLQVRLGWPEEERSHFQEVLLDLHLHFLNLPQACLTDELSDTVCYAMLAQDIQNFSAQKSFKLIEYFAHELYRFIKSKLGEVSIILTLTKTPPVAGLQHSAFTISDF